MATRGKQYRVALSKIDRANRYPIKEAVDLVVGNSYAKFDETVDIAVKLGVNPKHAEQMVKGACVLPHGVGKTVRILVVAKGDKELEAREAGADYVGSEDMIEKIKGGWLEFDRIIATPDMMAQVGKVGKILGPKGLMPNPKMGTVTFDVKKAVTETKSGKIEFKIEKAGILHAPVGKKSFGGEKLCNNIVAFLDTVQKAKPASSKGSYFRSITVSSTMGVGVKIDVSDLKNYFK